MSTSTPTERHKSRAKLLGRNMRSAIRDAKISQVAIARELDVSKSTIQNWLNGTRALSVFDLEDFGRLVGKTPNELLGRESHTMLKKRLAKVFDDVLKSI
jgi:transcriptional regulator with XRE-family HTH domain